MGYDNGRHFSDGLVEEVLESLGVEIVKNGSDEIICYCPLHDNSDTPSFCINAHTGLWICFSGACGRKGSIYTLHSEVAGFPLGKLRPKALEDFDVEDLDPVDDEEVPLFSQETIDLLESWFPGSPGEEYLQGRGLEKETCYKYHIGYDPCREMITVPVYDEHSRPVGLVGRSIEGKRFKNSVDLPRGKVLYNLNNAKRHSSVIVVESSLDVLRLDQAGFPNAVAMLGGSVSQAHQRLLNQYFTKLFVFTDNPRIDEAGGNLGIALARAFKRTTMFCSYPRDNAKDPGDLTDKECRDSIKNALTEFEVMV
jgi:DNA primase